MTIMVGEDEVYWATIYNHWNSQICTVESGITYFFPQSSSFFCYTAVSSVHIRLNKSLGFPVGEGLTYKIPYYLALLVPGLRYPNSAPREGKKMEPSEVGNSGGRH